MARLIVVEGPETGNEFEMVPAPGKTAFVGGRDPAAEIPLEDTAISRRHFQLEATGSGWRVSDLKSRNQTWLNGAPVDAAPIRHGDLIRAGDTELRFEDPGAPIRSGGVNSTIIKEIPAAIRGESLVERIESLERALREDRAPETVERLRRLLDVYGDVGSKASPQEALEKALAEVVPLVGGERGAILVEESGQWIVRAGSTADGAPTRDVRASTSVLGKVATEGKAVLSKDTTADERFRDRDSIVGAGIASVLAAPIPVAGSGRAVLYVDRREASEPFREEDLETLVAAARPIGAVLGKAAAEDDLRAENRNLYRTIGGARKIIGRSRAILGVLDFIRRAAPTPMTVLIEGETGTGKELVASAVHYSSPRRGRPFIAINCAALPENLVESELFGHERGAFTGAVTRKKGRFELADGGTIFLDEIAELSPACQAKLLRLLEEKVLERVGGVEPIRVDVRIVAATNKVLLDEVRAGSFREDLYYRLSVLAVSIPPLRDRSGDIAILAEHFLRECGGGKKRLGAAALDRLAAYSWPGNVRQLRNVIESSYVLGDGDEIRPEDLLLPAPKDEAGPGREEGAPPEPDAWKPMSLEDLERMHVERVLRHTGGNKKRAAEILGIERCTLYAKIKHFKL